MTHDDAFLQAILEAPEDDTPRLIYADWLDEHGELARDEWITASDLSKDTGERRHP
jgi:uncharacterized protein (TIGR02996 family)